MGRMELASVARKARSLTAYQSTQTLRLESSSISTTEVAPGGTVDFSFTMTVTRDDVTTIDTFLVIDGNETELDTSGFRESGSTFTVSRSFTAPSSTGDHSVQVDVVDGLSGERITVLDRVITVSGAEFSIGQCGAETSEIRQGSSTTLDANVQNTGASRGEGTIVWSVGGTEVARKTVVIDGGVGDRITTGVSFSTLRDAAGTGQAPISANAINVSPV